MIGRPVHLVADVLDEQVVDANHCNAGRVDGVIALVRTGHAPRVVAIEVGAETLAARVNRRLARWVARVDARITGRSGPFRIPWDALTYRDRYLQFDGDVGAVPIYAFEQWLRDHIVNRAHR
jgi:hypothetical protein